MSSSPGVHISHCLSLVIRQTLIKSRLAFLPGVSGVGDVELSAYEEGDRRRAATDDLVRLFVAKDQSEDEITNDVQMYRCTDVQYSAKR